MKFSTALPHDRRAVRLAWHAFWLTAITLCVAMFAPRAQAQDVDPPGRVARVSDIAGQVWLLPAESDEWVSAVRNTVVTTGDRIATEAGGRAELQVGSTTLRVDSSSELEVIRLDDDHLSLQLLSGSAYARLRNATDAGEFDINTDDGRFRALRAGRYRFDHKDNASHLTVYEGQAVYEGQNSALTLNPGQHAEFWIDQNNVAQYATSGPFNDTFAAWVNQRDPAPVQGPAMQYVSPEMTGAEDLDRYGNWEQTDDYGVLWTPRVVAVDWAPYRAGHWAWVRPWGWTWVDDAPWGFAPFHYGRWVRYRDRWCWAPGQRVVRPVYAPALVAWVGGPNVSVSVRVGGAPGPAVGWFPLAPREVYVPAYRVSPRYVQNVNITHVTNVTVINNVYRNPQAPRDYANRRYPGALTVVPAAVMTGREPVGPAASRFRDAPWAREIANRPPPTVIAPPVAAPPIAPRAPDRPAARPPGFPPPAVQAGGQPGRGQPGRRPGDDRPSGGSAAPGVVLPHTGGPGNQGGAGNQGGGRPDVRPPPTGPDAAGTQDAARPGLVLPNTERDGRRSPGTRPAPPNSTQPSQNPAPNAPAPQVIPARPVMTPPVPQPQIPGAAQPGRVEAPRNPREGAERQDRPNRPERPDRVERQRDPNDRSAGQALPHTAQQPQPQPVQRAPQPQQPQQPQVQQPHAPQPQVQQPRVEAPRTQAPQAPQAPEVRRPEAPRVRADAPEPRERGGGKKDQ